MPKGYTNKKEVEKYLGITLDAGLFEEESGDESGAVSQFDSWVEQVEENIDKITGRNFVADSVASARYFNGKGSNRIFIDDCISVSKVEIGDGTNTIKSDNFTELTSEEYVLEPENETPKIKVINMGGLFSAGRQNIKITAKWGYSVKVPKEILRAATIMVGEIISQSLPEAGEIQSITVGRYSTTFRASGDVDDSETAKQILENYKRIYF